MKQIINLTPYTLNINELSIPSNGIARVEEFTTLLHMEESIYGDIPIFSTSYGEIVGLLEETDDTIIVVSQMVARAAILENPRRADLYVPGKLICDNKGCIVGCEGLIEYTL